MATKLDHTAKHIEVFYCGTVHHGGWYWWMFFDNTHYHDGSPIGPFPLQNDAIANARAWGFPVIVSEAL